jgi:hypothetical protein
VEAKYFPPDKQLSLEIYKQLKEDQSKRMKQMFLQFHQEYLTYMRQYHRSKGCFSKVPIKVGDFVLIKNAGPARNFWPIARVTKILPTNDGIIRRVMIQKYLPFAINAALREAKYGKKDNQTLTKKQVQELTGYFEDQERPYSVMNLVPYELWKGQQAEPEDMDQGQVDEIEVKFENTRLKGSNVAFYAMGYSKRPISQINLFDTVPRNLAIREDDVWQSSHAFDPEYHQYCESAWSIAS